MIKDSYISYPSPERDINVIAATLKILKMPFAQPEIANILDLGCGSGAEVLHHAALINGLGTYVGSDINGKIFSESQLVANSIGLSNLTFLEHDFKNSLNVNQKFDYVIAHGVYSWIGEEERQGLLRNINNSLSDLGYAYISFNLMPGWSVRKRLRNELNSSIEVDGLSENEILEKARLYLSELSVFSSDQSLKAEAARCNDMSDAFILLELLGSNVIGQSMEEFQFSIAKAGLRLVHDKYNVISGYTSIYGAIVSKASSLDSFQKVNIPLEKDDFKNVFFSSSLTYQDSLSGQFFKPGGLVYQVESKFVPLIKKLTDTYPSYVNFEELVEGYNFEEAREKIEKLLQDKVVNIRYGDFKVQTPILKKPKIPTIIRNFCVKDRWVFTRKFEYVLLDDFEAYLLKLFDGKNDFNEIVNKVDNNPRWNAFSLAEIKNLVEKTALYFYEHALFY